MIDIFVLGWAIRTTFDVVIAYFIALLFPASQGQKIGGISIPRLKNTKICSIHNVIRAAIILFLAFLFYKYYLTPNHAPQKPSPPDPRTSSSENGSKIPAILQSTTFKIPPEAESILRSGKGVCVTVGNDIQGFFVEYLGSYYGFSPARKEWYIFEALSGQQPPFEAYVVPGSKPDQERESMWIKPCTSDGLQR